MTRLKKLETFQLRDKFNLKSTDLLKEARAAAKRRADDLGWSGIRVKKTDIKPVREGIFLCHAFEIFGTQSSSTASSDSTDGIGTDSDSKIPLAARQGTETD